MEKRQDTINHNLNLIKNAPEESLYKYDFRSPSGEPLSDLDYWVELMKEYDLIESEENDNIFFLTTYAYHCLDYGGWLDPEYGKTEDFEDEPELSLFQNDISDVLTNTKLRWMLYLVLLVFGLLVGYAILKVYYNTRPIETKNKSDEELMLFIIQSPQFQNSIKAHQEKYNMLTKDTVLYSEKIHHTTSK